jgi:reactive intermediate/imine deaminase
MGHSNIPVFNRRHCRGQHHGKNDHFNCACAGGHRHLFAGGQGRRYRLSLGPDRPRPGQHAAGRGYRRKIVRVFDNLKAVAEASGGSLADVVKLNVFLTDLAHFATVNEVMGCYFAEPFPARAAVGVAALPRGALVEADAVLVLGG